MRASASDGPNEPGSQPWSGLSALSISRQDLLARQDPHHGERARRARRHHRETVTIPRLRALGSVGLLFAILLHNAVFLGQLHLDLVLAFAGLQISYVAVSTYVLRRYYDERRPIDLGSVFLATDIVLFVLSIYASGGERSWLFAVLCVRVADQIGTSQRRAFAFATISVVLHALLVLYMAFVEQRGFSLTAELSKVALMYLMNIYLALAAGPGEDQRKRANRMAEVARLLIDELQRKTHQLELERARAQAASEAKGAFLANMSHEIRTPMTAVLGMAELLLAAPLGPREQDMAETILTSGRSLLALVNDILDMSKIEAGELALRLDEMDLDQVLQGALSPMRVLASSKGLALDLKITDLPPGPVCGDALRLKQVLLNLIGNAIKFTHKGGVTLSVRGLGESEDAYRVRFAVCDTGIGMTPEQLRRAFEPFQQADISTTRQFGGTGLGLSISRRLVGLMGSDLKARSEPGAGSALEFDLELPRGAASSAGAEDGIDAVELLRARAPRVLVAEDTEVNRTLFARMLQHLGCSVDCVENGELAVTRLAEDRSYDLVFMDWHMPVMDGLTAVARIRNQEAEQGRQKMPVVCVTASAFDDEVERCRSAGMDEVLSKPLIWAELERVLCQFVLAPRQKARISDRPGRSNATLACIDQTLLEEFAAMDDDPEPLLRGLFADLFAAVREAAPEIARLAAVGENDAATSKAHALKGGAAGVGAVTLASRLAEVERRLRAGENDLADPIARVLQEVSQTEAAADSALSALAPDRRSEPDRPSRQTPS